MGAAADFVRAPMAGAVHIRVIERRRKRKSSPLGWISDEILGGDDQPGDQPPPLVVDSFDWVDPSGATGSVKVDDASVDDDDLAELLRYGRRYGLGVSIWSESPALDRAMRLRHQWFPTPPVDDPHPKVSIDRSGDRVVIETSRDASAVGKLIGRVPRVGDLFGAEHWQAVLDPTTLRIAHRGADEWEQAWNRDQIVAVGPGLRGGTRVVTWDATDPVPWISQRGRVDDASRRMRTALTALSSELDR